MSPSPPKETDVEQGAPSPDNSEHMDRGEAEAQARELAYEFEVKEQDRWLPIANGWFLMHHSFPNKVTTSNPLLHDQEALRMVSLVGMALFKSAF